MKKFGFLILFCSMTLCCSSYNVKTELSDSAALKSFTKTGIVFRLPSNYEFTHEEMENNFASWLASSTQKKNTFVIKKVDPSVSVFVSDHDRFYQLSSTGEFQKYKSIGLITLFLRNNEEAVKKIFSDNQLDGILFYEVEGGASATMQFMVFNSTVAIVDSQMKVSVLDHQSNKYELNEWIPDTIKKHLMDKISERLMQSLDSYNFIDMKN